jgi:hypothetical protein
MVQRVEHVVSGSHRSGSTDLRYYESEIHTRWWFCERAQSSQALLGGVLWCCGVVVLLCEAKHQLDDAASRTCRLWLALRWRH